MVTLELPLKCKCAIAHKSNTRITNDNIVTRIISEHNLYATFQTHQHENLKSTLEDIFHQLLIQLKSVNCYVYHWLI